MEPLRDRMPVILPLAAWDAWLDPVYPDIPALEALLVPYPSAQMDAERVSTRVNSVRNDNQGLVEPVVDAPERISE